MAAAQGCSKCTAQKKGFRRELDSWRNTLIHCVGFESILEGIYGPMLLRDLSIFDDCEPEELDNWSMDASCSFCNLQLDKLNDHVPAAASPLSSPSDDTTSQAPPLLDSNQSAHRFLHAVLHKKDVPSSVSDHHLPLVAQELMRKMIHQFALEYASKGPLYAARNGLTTAGADTGSPPLSRTDPDAPLDLTVSRHQEDLGKEPQPDGVLDLSKRTSACSSQSPSNQEASGALWPLEDSQCEAEASGTLGDAPSEGGGCDSALQAVLRSLCHNHRSLLRQFLTLAYREHPRSYSSCGHHHRLAQAQPHCCHQVVTPQDGAPPPPLPLSDGKPHSRAPHYPFTDCSGQAHSGSAYLSLDCTAHGSARSFTPRDCQSQAASGSGCCCMQSCRVAATYPVGAVCFCLKSLHCLSCPSLAIGRINNVVCTLASASAAPTLCSSAALCPAPSVCPASAVCCSRHNLHPCPCYSEGAYLARVRHTAEGARDPQCPVLKRERTRSPSPPPLSPIPSDIHEKAEEKPPSLLHHRDEGDDVSPKVQDLHRGECDGQRAVDEDGEVKDDPECITPENCREEQIVSGSSLQDMVDRFSEKLETIKPQEKDLPPSSLSAGHSLGKDLILGCPSNQSPASQAERILTQVVHNDSDYNLSELFHRHDNNETQSPKTRSRRRQEALAAMTADQPPTRRQTLQIKRDLARLGQTLCGQKLPFGRSGRLKDGRAVTSSPSNSSSETSPVKEETEGIGEERQLERKREDWEKAESSKQEGTERAMSGEMEKERRTEIQRENGEKSEISESGGMKEGQEGEVAEDGEMAGFSKEWLTVDEGERIAVTEEIEAVIVTEEVKMELVMAEAGEEMVTVEKTWSADNQTPTTTQRQNSLMETQVKHEVETLSCSEACDRSHTDNLRRHKDSFAPIHRDGEALARSSGPLERGRQGRKARPVSVSGNATEAGRPRRNIVRPQRYVDHVTFVTTSHFSENIFSQRTLKDKPLTQNESGGLDSQTVREDSQEASVERLQSTPQPEREESNEIASECRPGGPESQVVQITVATAEGSPPKHRSQNRTDVRDSAARPYGRLRSSPTKVRDFESKSASKSPKKPLRQDVSTTENTTSSVESRDTQPQYTSPIKLMFVSPVVGEDGIKYTLKSAASDSSGQGEEMFDPCEETSWAGTPEKTASPPEDYVASSPKRSPTKSGESSPPKQAVGSDTPKSPGSLNGGGAERQDGLLPFHETTPPKRRPGRPKKLGPQLEKRAKRPIGRPPKQKCLDQTCGPGTSGSNAVNDNGAPGSEMEDKANKNLKITVVYGRSRRSKRLVSEDSGHLQTDIHEALHAESRNGQLDKNSLFQSSQVSAVTVKDVPPELAEDLNFVRPVKDRKVTPHSCSNIKCQKLQGATPLRKPGRPAKVKISGISVTVTTVSPRQRKIHMNRDTRDSPQKVRKKLLNAEFQPSKEPRTISAPTGDGSSTQNERAKDSDGSTERQREPEQPVPVRHSVRVRKPSVYLLHSVATSRSYSHSTALLRRSRQLLLNRASSQRKQQEEAQGGLGEASGEKSLAVIGQVGRWNVRKQVCQDLSRVAGVSVDSIFSPGDNVRWWAASTQEETLNQELARRIRLLSDTWISDTTDNQGGTSLKSRAGLRANGSSAKRPAPTSLVRMLFDCPPSKPRSCSMDQLCSWFMQTTETQSLAIVKKASTRNPYEDMHYPRATNRGSICPSLQSERLRKHVKKFAKAVPKSPTQHRQAQERLWNTNKLAVKRQLFALRVAPGRLSQRVLLLKGRVMGKYLSNLLRVKSKFLTRRERVKRPKRQRNNLMLFVRQRICANQFPEQVNSLLTAEPFSSAMGRSFESSENIWPPSPARMTEELVDIPKEQRLSSKAWSPETLKECRVFLKKINSPDTESTAEEWDTCTVTLDDGSPSAYCPNERRVEVREREEENKAVKMERKKKMRRKKKSTTKESICSPPKEILDQAWLPAGKRKGKQRSLEKVSSESLNPPPAKVTRQSRGKGLTGPRWCDFVLGSSK